MSMDELQIGAGTPEVLPELSGDRNLTEIVVPECPFGYTKEIPGTQHECIIHSAADYVAEIIVPEDPELAQEMASDLAKDVCLDMIGNLRTNVTADKARRAAMAREDVRHFDLMEIRPFLKTLGARLTRRRYCDTPIHEYLSQIEPRELAEKYLELYNASPRYKSVCAGAKHHHWWVGGLEQHVREMIGMGLDLMDLYLGDMPFTKSDLIIACFMHDFDKIWLYREITAEDRDKNPKKFKDKQIFKLSPTGRYDIIDGYSMRLIELAKFGIIPTDLQWSAILFHESAFSPAAWQYGGPSKTMETVNTKNLLAVLVNIVDMYSSHFLGRSIA